MEILECHSCGDIRFSAFGAKLSHGKKIETCYQDSKYDASQRQIKSYTNPKGVKPSYLKFAGQLHPCTPELRHNFYTMLWYVYFMENPELFLYAQGFQHFRDRFADGGKVMTVGDRYLPSIEGGCNQARSIALLVQISQEGLFHPLALFQPSVYNALKSYKQSTHAQW